MGLAAQGIHAGAALYVLINAAGVPLTDDDIKTAIRNASSLRVNLFVPEAAFENLSKQQIRRLESPTIQCVNMIYDELRRVVTDIDM